MKELYDLGIVHESDVEPFYPRVRDRADISVLRDAKTGVLFLTSTEHMNLSHYEEVDEGTYGYWGITDPEKAPDVYRGDARRRAEQFGAFIAEKDFIDIGCGTGALLEQVKTSAKSVAGVEPQQYMREALQKNGYTIYRLSTDAPKESFDVAGLFHVFEHFTEPLETLKDVRSLLRPGGTIVLEVPHARDILLKLDTFKAFTLWSEHLVLHTKESMQTYLEAAGFTHVTVEGFQRFPLANHVGWLVDGKPGGHERYVFSGASSEDYEKLLKETDQTDMLIATATK